TANDPLQNEKEQERGDGMQQHIGKMMAVRVKSEELKVNHVCDQRQRVPVHRRKVSEGPDDSVDAETTIYFGLFVNVLRIIEVDKWVGQRLAEGRPGDCNQNSTHP